MWRRCTGARACRREGRSRPGADGNRPLQLAIWTLQHSQYDYRSEQLDEEQIQRAFEDIGSDITQVEAKLPCTQSLSLRNR